MGPDSDGVILMGLRLQIRPYAFALTQPLQTAVGVWRQRSGWLLRLEGSAGGCGWGEVAPMDAAQQRRCARWVTEHGESHGPLWSEEALEQELTRCPEEVAFGLGAALAELQGLVGQGSDQPWLVAPASACLLPAGDAMPAALECLLASCGPQSAITVKWKVAAADGAKELRLLDQLLKMLPVEGRLRLDANGGWPFEMAQAWAERLHQDPRLEWLEQPLAIDVLAGHQRLHDLIPVALDEGLRLHPEWRQVWPGWQVRRPLIEGDPRPLLRQLQQGRPWLMVSTAFETGIGRRWLDHLAGLQGQGPTPAAPGLAPGWCPRGPLFSRDPEQVWAAAEVAA